MAELANIRATIQEDQVERKADGEAIVARLLADGSLVTGSWLEAHMLNGRIFTVNAGTVTGATSGASGFTVTAPDIHIQVPAGTTMYPLSIEVNIDALVADRDLRIVAATSTGRDETPADGTTLTKLNRNRAHSRGSSLVAQSDVTGITSPVTEFTYLEFWRVNREEGAVPTQAQPALTGGPLKYKWDWKKASPISLQGDSQFLLYVSGLGGVLTYFATVTWLELPS
jgi:hypothetical protein